MLRIVVLTVATLSLAACSGGSSMEDTKRVPTNSFRASGGGTDSPDGGAFWLVDVDFQSGTIHLAVTGDGGFERKTSIDDISHAPEQSLTTYRSPDINQTDAIEVHLYREECADITGTERPYRVEINHNSTSDQLQGGSYSGCGQFNGLGAMTTLWQLVEIDGVEVSTLEERTYLPTFSFLFGTTGVRGNGGCNRFNGEATVVGDSIKIGNLATTRMACPELDRESRYLEILSNGLHAVEIDGDEMTLTSERGVLTFRGR